MKSILTLIALIPLAGAANAETFNCQAGPYWLDGRDIVVTATIDGDGEFGTIEVAGISHLAVYRVDGFDRRWDFGFQDDGTFDYAFVLKPDGTAIYYDFSSAEVGDSVSGSQVFACK